MRRSNSVYRSFSALAALIPFSHSDSGRSHSSDIYPSFAADGCIFHLETLARSLGDTRAEKEHLLALVDLGRAAFIAAVRPVQTYDSTVMRAELLDAVHLQQYVPSPRTQSYLILFLQSVQLCLYYFCWQNINRLRKSFRFLQLVRSLPFLLRRRNDLFRPSFPHTLFKYALPRRRQYTISNTRSPPTVPVNALSLAQRRIE